MLTAAIMLLAVAAAGGRSEDQCLALYPAIRSPVEMARCTSDLAGSERALSLAYAKLRARVPRDARLLLERSQGAWIASRVAQCAYEAGGYRGSTSFDSDAIACSARLNRERAAYLRDELRQRWPSR